MTGCASCCRCCGSGPRRPRTAAWCRPSRSRPWTRPGSSGCCSRPGSAGYEADPVTFLTAVRLIASACGSTGWVSSVLGVHPWQSACSRSRRRRRSGATDAGTRISSSYAPTGQAEAVTGGHQLTGRWSFSSGCDHAHLGAARRDRRRTPRASRPTSAPSCCPPATTGSTTCGTPSGCAAPAATTSWWTARSCPSTARSASPTSHRCRLPGPGGQPGAAVPAAVRLGVLLLASPRRSSAWRPGRMTRTWITSGNGFGPPMRARRRRKTRTRRSGWPRRRPRSTRPGWRWSATWPS